MNKLFDCYITIAGNPKPLFRVVDADSAAEAKAKVKKAAEEQNVKVVKITAKRCF